MPLVPGPGQPFDVLGAMLMAAGAVCACCVSFPPSCLPGSFGCLPLAPASPPDPVGMPRFSDDVDQDAEWLVAESAAHSAASEEGENGRG